MQTLCHLFLVIKRRDSCAFWEPPESKLFSQEPLQLSLVQTAWDPGRMLVSILQTGVQAKFYISNKLPADSQAAGLRNYL